MAASNIYDISNILRRSLVVYMLFLITLDTSGQGFGGSLTTKEASWLSKRNFPIGYYTSPDSAIDNHLLKALSMRRNHQLLMGAGFASLTIFPPAGYVFFPLAGQVRQNFMSRLNWATGRWLTEEIGLEANEALTYYEPNAPEWYRKENFLVQYYDREDDIVNGILMNAFHLRKKSNSLYWVGGISAGVGGMFLLVGVLQALSNQDAAVYTLGAAGGLLIAAPIAILSGFILKGRARKQLSLASDRWYRRIAR